MKYYEFFDYEHYAVVAVEECMHPISAALTAYRKLVRIKKVDQSKRPDPITEKQAEALYFANNPEDSRKKSNREFKKKIQNVNKARVIVIDNSIC